jgi:hypothetical protein
MSLGILLLAVLAVLAGLRFTRTEGASEEGCAGVRKAYERVSFIEKSNDVPTSVVYRQATLAVRQVTVTAPPAVAQQLVALANAYARIAGLLQGFDPKVASTYHVYEDNTAAIEVQQTAVDETLPEVGDWLRSRCG